MSGLPGPAGAPMFRMLVVSEGGPEREFLARALKRSDYETVLAADGYEALNIAQTAGPFDLLVTDTDIPGIEGPELARRIRALDPSLKILYLTNEADHLFEERTALWEEEAFLEKPLTAKGVLEAVSLMLIGHIPPPRPVRVNLSGSRVRLDDRVADLVRFSVTGGLIQDSEPLSIGRVLPVALEFPTETLRLDCRVVRCQRLAPAPRDLSTPPKPYAIALAFVDVSSRDGRSLQRIVQEAWQAKQAPSLRGPIKP
jgi:CheY-like chemotaxis protein